MTPCRFYKLPHDYETIEPRDPITIKTERCRRCGVARDTLQPDMLIRNGEVIEERPRWRYRFAE